MENDKLYKRLGSVGGLFRVIITVGSCIVIIKYKLRNNIHSKCIKMKYKLIHVACIDMDGLNEAEPALLGGSRNQHLLLPVHGYQE